ncbi:MAG TPA: aspartate/glutamate racemase family protein [bacterium]|nr:aspartate/glutamate racemase family protein [bacterium]
MTERIVVINPNCNERVTAGMSSALEAFRFADGPAIECATLKEGPPGIESQVLSDQVIGPLCRMIRDEEARTGAFVVACFSDPGLHSARETTDRPVLGIAEAGMTTAMNLGLPVGVISILRNSLPRHRRYFRAMGVESNIAGDLPIDMTVTELADERKVFARMTEVGTRLRDDHGAAVIVMGCAGFSQHRAALEETLGLPVVDPTQAAVGMALSVLCARTRR